MSNLFVCERYRRVDGRHRCIIAFQERGRGRALTSPATTVVIEKLLITYKLSDSLRIWRRDDSGRARQDGRSAAHSPIASMPFDLNSARAEGPERIATRALAASACLVAAPIPAE